MKTLQATESLVISVLKTAILDLEKLNHLGITVKAVNSFLVLNEVLYAAQTLAHTPDRLIYGDLHVHDFAGSMSMAAILAIWRVCETRENVDVFACTSLTERSLMAHAK